MENTDKEVRFDIYCQTCHNKNTPETEDPCNDCLAEPINQGTKKPIFWSESK